MHGDGNTGYPGKFLAHGATHSFFWSKLVVVLGTPFHLHRSATALGHKLTQPSTIATRRFRSRTGSPSPARFSAAPAALNRSAPTRRFHRRSFLRACRAGSESAYRSAHRASQE